MRACEVQFVIGASAAHTALGAAIDKATELGIKINVAVVDSGGNLAGFLRMPGAPLHSIDIAIDKAYTAASFGIPTADWDPILAEGSAAFQAGFTARPRLVPFGGGLPLILDHELVGAIGVSGGSEAQDSVCAQAGLRALGADGQ